ncbi:MAG: DNA-directed RNA polymerase subunit omega [Chitinophagaceae bacterium]|nr:DNA-directed RNA polymerase subunit omega [Chitinophagaceae bacterium]HMN32725.1 DNA-directed RNA polymerase subunit omega [Chitinophagaceae bacterium]
MNNKRLLISTINPTIEAKDLSVIQEKTGNIYKSISIISKRANQINSKTKEELHRKLEEFGSLNDNLEEINENKEQIEISKFYERMANPAILATQELLDDKIYFKEKE